MKRFFYRKLLGLCGYRGESFKKFGHRLGVIWSVGNLAVTLCFHSLDYKKSRHPIFFEVVGNHVFIIKFLI